MPSNGALAPLVVTTNHPTRRIPALFFLSGALLVCFSCTPTTPPKTPAAPVAAAAPATTNTAAPAVAAVPAKKADDLPGVTRFSGERTPNVDIIVELLASLSKYDLAGRRRQAQKLGFELPAASVNEYLAYSLRRKPRFGIAGLTMKFLDGDKFSTMVAINFDIVKDYSAWTVPELVRPLLRQTRTVQVDSHFTAHDGVLRVTFDKAIGPDGTPITGVVSGLIRAIGLLQPEACDTDAPIPLPFGLQRVWTKDGVFAGNT